VPAYWQVGKTYMRNETPYGRPNDRPRLEIPVDSDYPMTDEEKEEEETKKKKEETERGVLEIDASSGETTKK